MHVTVNIIIFMKMAEDEDESRLSLAYRGLSELPREYIPKLEGVRHLDLSNNNFSYPTIM